MKIFAIFFAVLMANVTHALAEQPVVTDSRIKTFVYNEYDVFSVYTHYGYQTNIEFAKNEEIVTVSVGDRIAWQIVPVGRRLFIRPMEENARTNMTVITTARTYQFDLSSSGSGKLKPSEELVYVVRFYYPDDEQKYARNAPPPLPADEMIRATTPPPVARYNYRYSFSGADELAPLKVFDNGSATFFKLSPAAATVSGFYIVRPDGKEYPVEPRPAENGLLVIDTVAPRFMIRYGSGDSVLIYNEGI